MIALELGRRMSLFVGKSGVVGIRLATSSQIINENKLFVLYSQIFYEFEIVSRKKLKQISGGRIVKTSFDGLL